MYQVEQANQVDQINQVDQKAVRFANTHSCDETA
jgi:hypothetical protein